MASLQDYLIGLGYDVDSSGTSKFNSALTGAVKGFTAIIAVTATAAAGVVAFTRSQAVLLDQLSDLAIRTNTAVNSLVQLDYVANLTDSSSADLASTLENFSKKVSEASEGVQEASGFFHHLGINLRDGSGQVRETGELLAEVGDRLKGISEQRRVIIAEKLGINRKLLLGLTSDTKNLQQEIISLYNLAGVDPKKAVQISSDFNDSFFRLKKTFDVIKQSVATEVMPELIKLFDSLRKTIKDNLPEIKQFTTTFLNGLIAIIKVVGRTVSFISRFIKRAIQLFQDLDNITSGFISAFIKGIGLAIVAWKALNLAFMATPIGLIITAIVGAIAGLILIYDDFKTAMEGGVSLVNWHKVLDFFGEVGEFFEYIVDLLKTIWKLLTLDFSGALESGKDFLDNYLKSSGKVARFIIGDENVDAIKNLSLGDINPFSAPQPALANAPIVNNVNINSNVDVEAKSADANFIATSVGNQQDRLISNTLRNFKGNIR